MDKDANFYKILQLFQFFTMKFSYTRSVFPQDKGDEMWFVNTNNNTYQLIRATFASIGAVSFEKDRIDRNIMAVARSIKQTKISFLDIHITNEDITPDELYDSLCMEINHYSGVDLSDSYPGIKCVMHEVSDPEIEATLILKEIASMNKEMQQQKKILRKKQLPYVTYSLIALCIINFLFVFLLSNNYSLASSLVVMGADYTGFTLGIYQFWRLITVGLTHTNIIHLAMNMMSLYYLGSYFERKIGSIKFLLTILVSTLTGSLFSGAFTGNSISAGLSGGLYGVLALLVLDTIITGTADNSFYQMIFINILLNFVSGVNVLAHIGGFFAGIVMYFVLFDKKREKSMIIALVVMLISASLAYYKNQPIDPIYTGTDQEVLKIYRNIGLNAYADNLAQRLDAFYIRSRG